MTNPDTSLRNWALAIALCGDLATVVRQFEESKQIEAEALCSLAEWFKVEFSATVGAAAVLRLYPTEACQALLATLLAGKVGPDLVEGAAGASEAVPLAGRGAGDLFEKGLRFCRLHDRKSDRSVKPVMRKLEAGVAELAAILQRGLEHDAGGGL